MDFLRKHWEKLVLGLVLLVLLIGMGLLLRSVTATRKTVADLAAKARTVATGGGPVTVEPPVEAPLESVLSDPKVQFETLPAAGAPPLRGSLYEPPDYIFCYNEACNNIIPITSDRCPFCRTEQPPRRGGGDTDRDRDGIPNHIEQKYAFLSPDNPRDALQDYDRDGFLNVEEFARGTDMQDPASRPALGYLLRVDRLVERPLPVQLKKIARNNSDDPEAWSLTVQVYDAAKRTQRTRLVRVGAVVEGYTIRRAAFEPDPNKPDRQLGLIEVAPEGGGEPYILREGVNATERDKAVRLGFFASRDPQYFNRGGVRVFVQKAGDTITLQLGKDPKDPTKPLEETYRVETVEEGKVEVVRTAPPPAAGEAPLRITVPVFNPRTDFAVPSGGMVPGGMMEGGMMPGMEAEPGMAEPGGLPPGIRLR